MSIIKHVTLQKIVAHDFRYNPCISAGANDTYMLQQPTFEHLFVTCNHSSRDSRQELTLKLRRLHEPSGASLRENLSETYEQMEHVSQF